MSIKFSRTPELHSVHFPLSSSTHKYLKTTHRDTSADDLVTLRPEPVSSPFILPPCCPWKHLSMNPSCSPLPPLPSHLPLFCSVSFPHFLNYTFCHFHPSIHPFIPPPASLFLLGDQSCLRINTHRSFMRTDPPLLFHNKNLRRGGRQREKKEGGGGVEKEKNIVHVETVCLGFIIQRWRFSCYHLAAFKEKSAEKTGEGG